MLVEHKVYLIGLAINPLKQYGFQNFAVGLCLRLENLNVMLPRKDFALLTEKFRRTDLEFCVFRNVFVIQDGAVSAETIATTLRWQLYTRRTHPSPVRRVVKLLNFCSYSVGSTNLQTVYLQTSNEGVSSRGEDYLNASTEETALCVFSSDSWCQV